MPVEHSILTWVCVYTDAYLSRALSLILSLSLNVKGGKLVGKSISGVCRQNYGPTVTGHSNYLFGGLYVDTIFSEKGCLAPLSSSFVPEMKAF